MRDFLKRLGETLIVCLILTLTFLAMYSEAIS